MTGSAGSFCSAFRFAAILTAGLCTVVLSGCITFGNGARPEYVRSGRQYGVTSGLFRGRWWNYYERGRSFADGQFWDEAARDFRTALETREHDQLWARTYGLHFLPEYFPHRELGVVLLKQGRLEEAESELGASLAAAFTARAAYYLEQARRERVARGGLDQLPPQIMVEAKLTSTVQAGRRISIAGTVSDDTYVSKITVGETSFDVRVPDPTVSFRQEVTLHPGQNRVPILAEDISGRVSHFEATVVADLDGPVVSFDAPISVPGTIRGSCADLSGTKSLRVGGKDVTMETDRGGVQTFSVELGDADLGTPPLRFEAMDTVGNITSGPISLDRLGIPSHAWNALPPQLVAASHVPHALQAVPYGDTVWVSLAEETGARAQGGPSIQFSGMRTGQRFTVAEAVVQLEARSDQAIAEITLNDDNLVVTPGCLTQRVSRLEGLASGENVFHARVRDVTGRESEASVEIQRVPAPVEGRDAKLQVLLAGNVYSGNPPALADESDAVLDEVESALDDRGRFVLLDRQNLAEVLTEQALQAALDSRESRLRLGSIATAELMLISRVHHDDTTVEIVAEGISPDTGAFMNRADVAGKAETPAELAALCRLLAVRVEQTFPRVQGTVALVGQSTTVVEPAMLQVNPEAWQAGGVATTDDTNGLLNGLRDKLAEAKAVTLVFADSASAAAEEAALREGTASRGESAPLMLTGALSIRNASVRLTAELRQAGAAPLWTFDESAPAGDDAARAELLNRLASELSRQVPKLGGGRVRSLEGPAIKTFLGSRDGLNPNTRCLVYRDEGPDVDPFTGQVLGRKQTLLGDALLRIINNSSSTGVFLGLPGSAGGAPKYGDTLVTK